MSSVRVNLTKTCNYLWEVRLDCSLNARRIINDDVLISCVFIVSLFYLVSYHSCLKICFLPLWNPVSEKYFI